MVYNDRRKEIINRIKKRNKMKERQLQPRHESSPFNSHSVTFEASEEKGHPLFRKDIRLRVIIFFLSKEKLLKIIRRMDQASLYRRIMMTVPMQSRMGSSFLQALKRNTVIPSSFSIRIRVKRGMAIWTLLM